MSLIRQLWLAIALVTLIAFAGSAVVSSLSAKAYLEKQLLLKNLDNAASLASTLSQLPKDAVTIDLLIAAQFDTGHYERISLVDPQGRVIVERIGAAAGDGAPAWFSRLVRIDAKPGVAQVQDGWQQYGTLTLSSHRSFAYRELWNATLRLLGWFLAAAVLTGVAGTVVLRLILRPLDGVVRQAQAIGERRFITSEEPATAEFRAVVRSMNALAARVRQMLEVESQRLDQLRRAAHHDPVSGLFTREHFLARVDAALGRDDAGGEGAFVIVRLPDLQELNRSQGWAVMDVLIQRFAQALLGMAPAHAEWVAGRLNGSEFAVLAAAEADAGALARRVQEALQMVVRELHLETACRLCTGATDYHAGELCADLLARADAALATALAEGGVTAEALPAVRARTGLPQHADLATWHAHLDAALVAGHVKLRSYPVITRAGAFLHGECVARLRLSEASEWMRAQEFVPWLVRLGNVARLDEMVVDLAIESLRGSAEDLCINLSAQSMNDSGALHRIAAKLGAASDVASRLALEVPEHGVFLDVERFRVVCGLLKPTGCRVGIEHVGHQVARIGQLHDLGIDYIKIDAAFVKGIDLNPANQVFLRGLALIAHSIGLTVIAEGVDTEAEYRAVVELGFDGATGPAITARQPVPMPRG